MTKPFNTGEPLAYFLTWTTYGTWLPGDDRGWHRRGGGWEGPNSSLEAAARAAITEPDFTLSREHRQLVEQTIREHCRIRGWFLHAVNARSNHVHVVVTALGYPPETVAEQFKAWCTRRLKEAGCERKKFWTERESKRYINTEDDLESAIVYVVDAQDRKHLDE